MGKILTFGSVFLLKMVVLFASNFGNSTFPSRDEFTAFPSQYQDTDFDPNQIPQGMNFQGFPRSGANFQQMMPQQHGNSFQDTDFDPNQIPQGMNFQSSPFPGDGKNLPPTLPQHFGNSFPDSQQFRGSNINPNQIPQGMNLQNLSIPNLPSPNQNMSGEPMPSQLLPNLNIKRIGRK